nr:response regulator transcription factor [Desulfobulbaceae bacterium]
MTNQTDSPVKPKVLLAEDNPTVRRGIENFLGKWGYEAIEADNGDSAWNELEKDHTIRIAIVDWNLPGLSGIQICQRLRTRTNAPYVYAIMFSARKSHEEKIMALDGGADDYIVKPCKPSELRARLGVARRIIDTAMGNLPSCSPNPPINSNESTIPKSTEETSSDKDTSEKP